MRDGADQATAELPAMAPPAKATPEDVRRRACAYQGPRTATACRNCTFRRPPTTEASRVHRCHLHRFDVELGGICADWTDGREWVDA
jgi:hypothetical protein